MKRCDGQRTRNVLTVPEAPSIVPAHSNRLDSDLGNADC